MAVAFDKYEKNVELCGRNLYRLAATEEHLVPHIDAEGWKIVKQSAFVRHNGAPGFIDVFGIGDHDGHVYHSYWRGDGKGWGPWTGLNPKTGTPS
jgi:hypothetical protein